MKKLAMLTAMAILLTGLCAAALADVGVGDRGEEVRYLQWLLIQTGWLSGGADGAFGPKTEQAVIDYQTSKGIEPTGVADAALMLEIDRDRVLRDKETHGQDYYQPYPGDYDPPMVANAAAASHCAMTVLPGIAYQNGCEAHLALAESARALCASGDAESLMAATALWQADIARQLAESGASDAIANAWAAYIDATRDALGGDAPAARQALSIAQNVAQALCELRSGALPVAANMESVGLSGGERCAKWSFSADKTFITACDAHDALFGAEREWVVVGAADDAALSALTEGWDAALNAVYDEWAAGDGDGAENVEAARAACFAALSAQDAAFAGGAALGHMRLAQLETTRICEMLGNG